jgi:hypothetical protein
MKYLGYIIFLFLIALLVYQISQQSIYKHRIPYGSVFISRDSVISISMDWQRKYTAVQLLDLKNDQSVNLSKGTLIEKCLPVYYNDSIILWSYDLSPQDKWATLNYYTHIASWIAEEEALALIKSSVLLYQQPQMTDHTYDPAMLPDAVFLAGNFQGAQVMVDNKGQEILYQGKPVLIIQTGNIEMQSVNRFSRFHRHRFISVLVKKYYIGLYDEQMKRFDWAIKCDEPSSPHHRTVYFDGVYRSSENEVMLLIDNEMEKIRLDKGTIEKFKEIEREK